MGLLDSILGAASGKTDASGEANPLIGILGGLLAQSGGLQVWPISFRKAAVAASLPPGSAWAKTSPSRAIKFKRRSVPNKCRRWRQKWELILRKPRISWLNFCQRWSTN